MKRIIGFSLILILSVLFSGIVYGVDENAAMVSASDIWFPADVNVWTFMFPDGDQARVWISEKPKSNVFLSDTYFINETKPVFGDSPFSVYWTNNGNILGCGNEMIKSLWVGMAMSELGLTLKEAQDMEKTFKFSSEEWLLIPAQLSDGSEWEVVKYEFKNPFGVIQGSTIKGHCSTGWNLHWSDPLWNSPVAEKLGKTSGIHLSFSGFTSEEDDNGLYFDCLEKIGVIELGMFEEGRIDPKEAIKLVGFQKSQDVSNRGKMTTSWGKMKTQ